MDLLALFAITVIGVACFLLLLGGFWMAPWLMVVILVGLLLVLLKIPLFSQDEPFPTEDEEFAPEQSRTSVPLGKLLKRPRPVAETGVAAASSITLANPVPDGLQADRSQNDRLQSMSAERKALSYRGVRYKHDTETGAVATANLIECEGRYRGNRSKLFAVKEKLD